MANIQPQFEQFDATIRLGRFDESQTLREKRNIIREKLEKNLPQMFAKHNEPCPTFYFLDQGSYPMDTGVKPLDGDFDIDQGLYFELAIDAYPDPVALKERVYEALEDHTDNVCIRRSCVTVFYHKEGEAIYHIDIAIYSDAACNADGKSYTAKGKQHSDVEHRVWQVSDPQRLTDTIFAKFADLDRKQFRRIVRIWKRWKAWNFPKEGNAAPNGIGLTVAAYDRLCVAYSDPIAGKHDDLRAMRQLVTDTLSRFATVWDPIEQAFVRRLVVTLPIEPSTDLLARMTAKQMAEFETKLTSLKEALEDAERTSDAAACSHPTDRSMPRRPRNWPRASRLTFCSAVKRATCCAPGKVMRQRSPRRDFPSVSATNSTRISCDGTRGTIPAHAARSAGRSSDREPRRGATAS